MDVKHYLVVFVIVMVAVIAKLSNKIDTLEVLDQRSTMYNETIDNAVDDSLNSMLEVQDSFEHTINLDVCNDTFFKALFAGFGVSDSPTGKDQLKMYVPLLLVTDTDGFYIMCHSTNNAGTQTTTAWTPKQPYCYNGTLDSTGGAIPMTYSYQVNYTMGDEVKLTITPAGEKSYYFEGNYKTLVSDYTAAILDSSDQAAVNVLTKFMQEATKNQKPFNGEYFTNFRNSVMIYQITKKMNYYVNQHNQIARNYGISYTFELPESAMDSFSRTINDISLLAIFQGYPYGKGTDDVYSRFSVSGARLYKADRYQITKEGSLWYYHRASCSKVANPSAVLDSKGSRAECAALGAYACPDCRP